MLIRAGASDVSWTEHGECCLDLLLRRPSVFAPYYAQSFINMGADPCLIAMVPVGIYCAYSLNMAQEYRLTSVPGIDEDRFRFNGIVHPLVTAIEEIWTEEDCDNVALAIQMMSVPLAQSRTLVYKLLVAACRSPPHPGSYII
ncbi:hypothetical protein SCAR479_05263 [Seiridium cardinale]|uniref:Uncharacterized protein n=1 Tax=Seiridium cardinale TaxID=138064 RepID=A0ABR2XW50_9PEZI